MVEMMFPCDICGCEIPYSAGDNQDCPGCGMHYAYAEGSMPILTPAMKEAIKQVLKIQNMNNRKDGIV
jgi:hypothetical protein